MKWAASEKFMRRFKVPIDNPNELDEIYDSITYAKSNSINRMLCNFLGEPVFQKGLQIYLKNFQYSNAETLDLWKALGEASGQVSQKRMFSVTWCGVIFVEIWFLEDASFWKKF